LFTYYEPAGKLWNVLAVNGIKIFLCPMGNKLILPLTAKNPELKWEALRKQRSNKKLKTKNVERYENRSTFIFSQLE